MIEGGHAIAQKFVYLVGNVACLALALYKCQSMGLLPTHASDWLEFVEAQQVSSRIFLYLNVEKPTIITVSLISFIRLISSWCLALASCYSTFLIVNCYFVFQRIEYSGGGLLL